HVASRILAGESVVWVLVEGGDAAGDDRAAKVVATELKKLEKTLKLPEGIEGNAAEEPANQLRSQLPLRLAFSTLRLSRKDPAEEFFLKMLLAADPDLAKEPGPLVFPIFGRGRILAGLAGKGITPGNLRDMASFLIGACSCQVKRLNPGSDSLLAVDWEPALQDVEFTKPKEPPLPGIGQLGQSGNAQPVTPSPQATSPG